MPILLSETVEFDTKYLISRHNAVVINTELTFPWLLGKKGFEASNNDTV